MCRSSSVFAPVPDVTRVLLTERHMISSLGLIQCFLITLLISFTYICGSVVFSCQVCNEYTDGQGLYELVRPPPHPPLPHSVVHGHTRLCGIRTLRNHEGKIPQDSLVYVPISAFAFSQCFECFQLEAMEAQCSCGWLTAVSSTIKSRLVSLLVCKDCGCVQVGKSDHYGSESDSLFLCLRGRSPTCRTSPTTTSLPLSLSWKKTLETRVKNEKKW